MVKLKKWNILPPVQDVSQEAESKKPPTAVPSDQNTKAGVSESEVVVAAADVSADEPCRTESRAEEKKVKKSKTTKTKLRHGPVLLKRGPTTLAPLLSVSKTVTEAEETDDPNPTKKISKKKKKNVPSKSTEKSKTGKLSLRELAASVEKKKTPDAKKVPLIVKELTNLAKKKSLSVPLRKPVADRVSRIANYEDVKRHTDKKWSDVVKLQKSAPHISFPLPVTQSLDDTVSASTVRKVIRTEMEQKIDALLSSSENRLEDNKSLTPGEEKLLQSLSVEEAKARIAELQRTRALLSYHEAKMKREAKIKSKSYHRIRKREKLREALKDFETLKQSDPEAALKQLAEFDKARALERASLRHRNTGKFAKQAKIRAKYNDEARAALEAQMLIHQQNMKRREYDSDDEEEEVTAGDATAADDVLDSDVEGDGQLGRNNEGLNENHANDPEDMGQGFDVADSYNPWLKPTTKQSLENEAERVRGEVAANGPLATTTSTSTSTGKAGEVPPQIRLRKSFLQNPKDDIIDGEAATEEPEDDLVLRPGNQMEVIKEAFAEDDVVQEFTREREEESRKRAETAAGEQEMPGWGSWTGVGADSLNKTESRKRLLKRKQEYKANLNKKLKTMDAVSYDPKVVINADTGTSNHRVKQLPFPFRSVPDFEAGILSNPIGRTFVPETAFRVLTREKVSTKMGTIIPPLSEENIRKRKSTSKGKKKDKNKKIPQKDE